MNSNEIEQTIIGSILSNPKVIDSVMELIEPNHFNNPVYMTFYKTLVMMSDNSIPMDYITLQNELNKIGCSCYHDELTDILRMNVLSYNIENYCLILKEQHLQRKSVELGNLIIRDSVDGDILENIDRFSDKFEELQNLRNINPVKSPLVQSTLYWERLNKLINGELKPVHTGIKEIDDKTAGFVEGEFIIVAARTSIGKTAFLLSILNNMSLVGNISTGIITLEMSMFSLMNRLCTMHTGIPSWKLRTGDLSEKQIYDISNFNSFFSNKKFFIDDNTCQTESDLRRAVKRLIKKNVQVIAIDYLQLFRGTNKNQNRDSALGDISGTCLQLAKEYDIRIIGALQINREAEHTKSKRPSLSNLRECGKFELDAHIALLIHRPEFYGDLKFDDGSSSIGRAEIIIAKNREGIAGISEKINFDKNTGRFYSNDYTKQHFQETEQLENW
jgi:replicative DNA helicase